MKISSIGIFYHLPTFPAQCSQWIFFFAVIVAAAAFDYLFCVSPQNSVELRVCLDLMVHFFGSLGFLIPFAMGKETPLTRAWIIDVGHPFEISYLWFMTNICGALEDMIDRLVSGCALVCVWMCACCWCTAFGASQERTWLHFLWRRLLWKVWARHYYIISLLYSFNKEINQ